MTVLQIRGDTFRAPSRALRFTRHQSRPTRGRQERAVGAHQSWYGPISSSTSGKSIPSSRAFCTVMTPCRVQPRRA